MKKYFRKKRLVIAIIIFILACLVSGWLVHLNFKKERKDAFAASCGDNNVAGFAWSDNIGWISFNSADCDQNNNGYIDKDPPLTGAGGNEGKTSSIAVCSDGLPVVSYYDETNGDLKFIKCESADCGQNKPPLTLDTGVSYSAGYSSVVAIGQDGYPMIAYQKIGALPAKINFIKCNSCDCENRESPVFIDNFNAGGTQARWMAINQSGWPTFVYRCGSPGLCFAQCQNVFCSGTITYEDLRQNPYNEGEQAAIAIGADNLPVIVNVRSGGSNEIDLVKCAAADCSSFDTQYLGIKINPAGAPRIVIALDNQDFPMIAYYDAIGGNDVVRYIKCSTTNCSSYSSPLTIYQYTGPQGGSMDMFKDSDSNPLIALYDNASTQLVFKRCLDASCSSIDTATLDYNYDVGAFPSIAIVDNKPVITYYDATNGDLRMVSCADMSCSAKINRGCGGNDDATTPVIPYGVKIDWPTGNFSGYGWSSNIGWISFQENNSPPDNYAFNSSCSSTCNNSNNCTACLNSTDNKVYGWAKALSLGDDGWMWSDGVKINSVSREFEGWAWNGNNTAGTGIGWLSFSHLNCDTDGDGTMEAGEGTTGCPAIGTAISNYKVYLTNTAPTAIDLKAPNITYEQACSTRDARRVQLTWDFSDPDTIPCGDYQSAYQVIADSANHTTAELDSMAVNTTRDLPFKTPKLSGSANSIYPTNPGSNPDYTGVDLYYDAPYYWWVKVWDKFGEDSGWVQYDSLGNTTDTPAIADDGAEFTFTTYKHEFPEFPDPPFIWFPLEPSKEEKILFSAEGSQYYTAAEPNTNPQLCSGGAACGYEWSVMPPLTADIDDDTAYSTNITFHQAKIKQTVTLQVTDGDDYYCAANYEFFPLIKLPKWKEVKYK